MLRNQKKKYVPKKEIKINGKKILNYNKSITNGEREREREREKINITFNNL